jgi:hypothetical protein
MLPTSTAGEEIGVFVQGPLGIPIAAVDDVIERGLGARD